MSFHGKRYHVLSNALCSQGSKKGIVLQECGQNDSEVLILTPTQSGKSVFGDTELVSVRPTDDYHVQIESLGDMGQEDSQSIEPQKGPCRASSQKFRDGWDRAYGSSKKVLN
jgi:hypothetical protein